MLKLNEEKKVSAIEELESVCYGYCNSIADNLRRRIVFTNSGLMRLATVIGYIVGLKHGGQVELAATMATEFLERLRNWIVQDETTEFTLDDGQKVKVPSRKCILGDDGCLHSFTLLWMAPIDPNIFNTALWAKQKEYEESDPGNYSNYRWALEATIEELRIVEFAEGKNWAQELTEYKAMSQKIYYRSSHNGGLIYHGPGQGETFTISLGSSGKLWGIHT